MAVLVVGTEKGAWLLRRDDHGGWDVTGPSFPGWQVTALGRAADGTFLAGVGSGWFGPAVHRSPDLTSWEQVTDGPSFGPDGPQLEQIWSFTTTPDDTVLCGVAQAGLFTSDDHGVTWGPVPAYNEHPTRPQWQPGAGGMCAHTILLDGDRMWVAASAIGVFRSDDGGASFSSRNAGIGAAIPDGLTDDEGPAADEVGADASAEPGADEDADRVGYCVHAITADPAAPDVIWRQDHTGVYRTTDGGDRWERIERGLPASFGFPIVRDAASGALFVVPLEADVNRTPVDGRFAAWRSLDGGDSWHESGVGWPTEPTYTTVLRGAAASDGDGGVYLGTTSGEVWSTDDAGDTWQRLPGKYPRIDALAVW